MKQKLGLGVLGLGEGRSILSAATASADYVVRGICDINEKLCKERAAEFAFSHLAVTFKRVAYLSYISGRLNCR